MDVKQAYNIWADQYDSNINKTRDLEALAFRNAMENISFQNCLEIGCGTGKNTAYLFGRAQYVEAVDFSHAMLKKARVKISSENVRFVQADIKNEWQFIEQEFDLVTFSLVLEHIENLDDTFKKVSNVLSPSGHVYVGELHPYKQYTGTKARFDTEHGEQVLTCFLHNISDFTESAKISGLRLIEIKEYFDEDEKVNIPRILSLIFRNER